MEFNDVLGLGKVLPLEKLIEVISKACGRISKSYFDKIDTNNKANEIKKLAEARAFEITTIAKSIHEAPQLTDGLAYNQGNISIHNSSDRTNILNPEPIDLRSQNRLLYQNAVNQLNIESITSYAANDLKNETQVSDTHVDEDWITRFFNYAKEISNEEMQIIWGKILAGEVKSPNSYSLRTLEILRNLTKEEADILIKIADFVITLDDDYFIFKGKRTPKGYTLHEIHKIRYSDMLKLMEAGIIQSGDLNYEILRQPHDIENTFFSSYYAIFFTKKANDNDTSLPIFGFTKSGSELLCLLKTTPNIDYLNDFGVELKTTINKAIVNEVHYSVLLNKDDINSTVKKEFPIE